MHSERSTPNMAAAIAVAILVVYVIVWLFRHGGIYSYPVASYILLAVATAIPWLSRFRRFAAGSGVLAVAAIVFSAYSMLIAYGYVSSWYPKALGIGFVIGLPVAIVCAAIEIVMPSTLARLVHPSSPVAATSVMFFSTVGTDTITSYHGPEPFLAAALTSIALPWLSVTQAPSSLNFLLRALGPTVVVMAAWAVAYLIGRGEVQAADLRWLLPYIAVPATAGATIGALKSMRWGNLAA